jgi:hypothetical protein
MLWRFNTANTKARHWIWSIRLTLSQYTSLRSILMLSFHLLLGLLSRNFPRSSPPSIVEVKERVELYLHCQYTFMAWCSVKKKHRGQLYLYLYLSQPKFCMHLLSTHHSFLDVTIITILCDLYTSRSSSLHNILNCQLLQSSEVLIFSFACCL